MRITSLVVLWVMLHCIAAIGQQKSVPLGTQLRLRWHGKSVVVIKGSERFEYSLDDELNSYELDSVKLLSAKESNGFIYLLLEANGPSRGRSAMSGYCGAGFESDLVWLKLNARWDMVDSSSFLQGSCLQSVDGDKPAKWNGSVYHFEVINRHEATWYSVTYSFREPEKGLQIVSKPAPSTP